MTATTQVDRTLAVDIAKDVLEQIGRADVPLPIWHSSGYLQIDERNYIVGEAPSEVIIDDIQAHCQVCMLGGMFLSLLRLNHADVVPNDPKRDEIVESLGAAFPGPEADMIESAFECTNMLDSVLEVEDEAHAGRCDAAARWGWTFGLMHDPASRVARARAICEAIIANGGTFIIPTDH